MKPLSVSVCPMMIVYSPDGILLSEYVVPSGEYTIISGQTATESGFNIIYGDIIPCAAGFVMIIISGIILSLGTTKKKENE